MDSVPGSIPLEQLCTPFYTNSIPPSTTAGGLRAPPAHLIFPMKTAPAQAAVPAACPKSTFLASFAHPGEAPA
jgi:hypothetical protein